ncbi:MAG: glycosyltransferase [Methylococcales bacterium]
MTVRNFNPSISHSMQRVVWVNKGQWLQPGPIVYMGLLNALAFAENNVHTDFFVGAGPGSDTESDIKQFYGLASHPKLTVQRIAETGRGRRKVYSAAMAKISSYCEQGLEVLALTRELGCLTLLVKLKKKYPKLKVLHEAHDYYLSTRHLPEKNFSISSLRRQWTEKNLLPKIDGLICLTEHQRALYQQWLPQLPTVALSLGCVAFARQPQLEQRRLRRRIAYIGLLHGYKGVELIFSLAKQLKPQAIELYSYGGSADDAAVLQQRADQEGLAGALFFKAFIDPKSLHHILDNEISLGLVPLQDTFYNRYLTCPVKALDFMAHGLPVLASELPSIREVLRETGFYCDSQNAADFAAGAIALLADAQAYQAATAASYARSTALQWRVRGQKILDFAAYI